MTNTALLVVRCSVATSEMGPYFYLLPELEMRQTHPIWTFQRYVNTCIQVGLDFLCSNKVFHTVIVVYDPSLSFREWYLAWREFGETRPTYKSHITSVTLMPDARIPGCASLAFRTLQVPWKRGVRWPLSLSRFFVDEAEVSPSRNAFRCFYGSWERSTKAYDYLSK